jgi:transposase
VSGRAHPYHRRWRDLPQAYGAPTTCWTRLRQWEAQGVGEHIGRVLLSTLEAQGKLAWAQAFLDDSFVPAKRGEQG